MARYNRDFLVPYLEDICALHLSKQKILQMIAASEVEINNITRNALARVDKPELEAYKGEEDLTGVGTGCIGGVLCLASIIMVFASPFIGVVSGLGGALVIGIGGMYMIGKSMGAKYDANREIKKRNDEKERNQALEEMAALSVAESEIEPVKKRITFLKDESDRIDELLEKAYSANVIPRWYRDVYPAVYLYDWFSNSRADDLDVALNTLVLEQIKDRLDTIIRNQGEMIINQRIMIANQKKSMEQAERHHAEQMEKLNRIVASNEDRNMYLSMIEANTAANAYFAAANYLK